MMLAETKMSIPKANEALAPMGPRKCWQMRLKFGLGTIIPLS